MANSSNSGGHTQLYGENDGEPFRVVVCIKNTREINVDNFQELLINNGVRGVKKIEKKNLERVLVDFNNGEQANDFVCNSNIRRDYKVFIPYYMVISQGVIKGVDLELSDQEIKNNIKTERRIMQISRITRRACPEVSSPAMSVPTKCIAITFYGNILPNKIKFFYEILKVEEIIRCSICNVIGHTSNSCFSNERFEIQSDDFSVSTMPGPIPIIKIPPSMYSQIRSFVPNILLNIGLDKNSNTFTINSELQSILRQNFPEHTCIYTDASVVHSSQTAGYGIYVPNCCICMNQTTSFMKVTDVELLAIMHAVTICPYLKTQNFLILTDCLSSLIKLSTTTDQACAITDRIKYYLHILAESNYNIILAWIPGHRNIYGNEKADSLARHAAHI